MNKLVAATKDRDLEVVSEHYPEAVGEQRYEALDLNFPTTVQVTLAKRIIRAGSNKVLCLAAQTSVPLHDDDLASVSDLGLKLSDGTSVVLSLSSFNDKSGTAYQRNTSPGNWGRSHPSVVASSVTCERIYDPARYEPDRFKVRSMPAFPMLIVILAVAAGLAAFHWTNKGAPATVVTRPVHPAVPIVAKQSAKLPAKSAPSASISDSPLPISQVARPPKPVTLVALRPPRVRENQISARHTPKAEGSRISRKTNSSNANARSTSRRQGGTGFFVPPPPPVIPLMAYPDNYPYAIPPQPVAQRPPATVTKPTLLQPVAQRPPATVTQPTLPEAPADPPAKRTVKPPADLVIREEQPVPFSINSNGKFGEPFQEFSPTKASNTAPSSPVKHTRAASDIAEAPVPGPDAKPLERIVWPEQSQ